MSVAHPPRSGERAGTREWLGLAVLFLPVLLLALDNTVLFLALPHLSADLEPTGPQMLWIMDIYGFMIAGFLITMGTLGDRIGRRRLLMIGAVTFGLASLAAAYSTSAEMLILTRALLGVTAATLMPSSLALISNMFTDRKQRALAIGVWMAAFSGGAILGPVVGGVLLEWFWWGSVFLLGVPVMVLLLALGPFLLPEYRNPDAGRVDFPSVLLSLAAILPFIYGFKELAKDGFAATPILLIAAGAVVGVVFGRRQLALDDPLLDLRLFVNRSFSAALGIMLIGMGTIGGVYLFVTQYLQLVEGLSPLQAGLRIAPAAMLEMIVAVLVPLLARRLPPPHIVATGLVVMAAGLLVLTQVDSAPGLGLLLSGMFVVFLGTAPLMVLSTDLVIATAPAERAGSAAALPEVSGEFGIAMGVASLGSLGTVVYSSGLSGNLPAAVPAEMAEMARESLAGATSVAGQLPAELGAEMLDAARKAFTDGLNTTSAVSAGLLVGLAILTMTLLRHVRPIGQTHDDQEPATGPHTEKEEA
ncbi:MFS transporter [Phytoactinopolyspora mesophila]|uniref:MFS transporter n=1 Tax=Phytoactinopolyspora mesophila TaxID=2650750 RepID=A0A7K3M6X5_9ACTN|nr:MFS transporter [Phytoactinopolyspora mesophila]NDL58662.1 MFS transporter [Phytoactinopolyspora mesophila]